MARKRKQGPHANHERWLVSYADFVTLLFAFFVMLYANSNTNKAQAQRISESFREAMAEGRVSQAFARILNAAPAASSTPATPPKAAPPPALPPSNGLQPSLHQLNDKLATEIGEGRVEIHIEQRGLVVSLREATLFPVGDDTVSPSALPMLQVIANEIRAHPNPIRMEGHTDSVPIRTARFRSNWELSAARAIAMLDLFAGPFGLDRARMSIGGFGDTVPLASNLTPEGRNRNRRVDIVVLTAAAAAQDPQRR